MEKAKAVYETIKAWSETVSQGYFPWWVVPVAAVVVLAILL